MEASVTHRVVVGAFHFALLWGMGHHTAPPGMIQEFCPWTTFNASCLENEVIVMERALYGRMPGGHCFQKDLDSCYDDVMDLADLKCSGRRQCGINIPDADFENLNICPELKNYFKAKYKCVKVEGGKPMRQKCNSCDFVRVRSTSGFLASSTSQLTGCGNAECPWLIEARPGQTISIKLWDFSVHSNAQVGYGRPCRVYAVLKEPRKKKSHTICGDTTRERDIYTTSSETLSIRVLGRSKPASSLYFMLQFQVNGCGDLDIAGAGYFRRVGNQGQEAVVRCDAEDIEWKLRCNGTHWEGKYGFCAEAEEPLSQAVHMRFSFGLSIAIIIAISILIGIVILIVGLFCFKRYRVPNNPPGSPGRLEESPYDARNQPESVQYHDIAETMGKGSQIYSDVTSSHGVNRNNYTHIWEMPLPTQPPKGEDPQRPHPDTL